jgi:hypothetical protein
MQTRFMIEKPGEVMATMQITMTIAEWDKLNDQLQINYPSIMLITRINDMLRQARKIFYPTIGDKITLIK